MKDVRNEPGERSLCEIKAEGPLGAVSESLDSIDSSGTASRSSKLSESMSERRGPRDGFVFVGSLIGPVFKYNCWFWLFSLRDEFQARLLL